MENHSGMAVAFLASQSGNPARANLFYPKTRHSGESRNPDFTI
jgi:hypothetical protein